jgi:hypothetical protein
LPMPWSTWENDPSRTQVSESGHGKAA